MNAKSTSGRNKACLVFVLHENNKLFVCSLGSDNSVEVSVPSPAEGSTDFTAHMIQPSNKELRLAVTGRCERTHHPCFICV